MNKKASLLILLILLIGALYRFVLTSDNNFFFNMDNARDFVDVREMVMLKKLRLIGPTSAIEGFYNGPAWYYLLSIPFIFSGGDPYSAIIMEIILWTIGGYFLMKLVSRLGYWLIIPIGSIWIASDYVVLANRYAFNPNPVTLLTPVFIFFILKYIETKQTIFSILAFLLGGLFFNFEMNFGAFAPFIIIVSLLLGGKGKLIKTKSFWTGVAVFMLTLLPQVLFDVKHQFIMSKSVINYLLNGEHPAFNIFTRLQNITGSFYEVFLPMLMHNQFLIWTILGLIVLVVLKRKQIVLRNNMALICIALIAVPFIGYLLLPINVNLWHLGAESVAFIILIGFIFKTVWEGNFFGKTIAAGLGILITIFSLLNVLSVFENEIGKESGDSSLFRNEISAIDYIYKYANGRNFKVYSYLPSVYDYPYQYLFWWMGMKRYGYIPAEYAYSPNKPQYISNKEKFEGIKENYSGLIFLIKEPDRINKRQAWEGDFSNLTFIKKEWVGPIEIEVRQETE